MSKLIITRGLPGSGKTRNARAWVEESPLTRVRVNRDDLRMMMHGVSHYDDPTLRHALETAVTKAQRESVTALLRARKDVVVDDTNLRQRTAREWLKIATDAGAEFEVWDLTDRSLNDSLAANARRTDGRVPDEAIERMYDRYLRGKPTPLPLPEIPPGPSVEPYVPHTGADVFLVDIDGTVALRGDRGPYDETRVLEDAPNDAVVRVVWCLEELGYRIVFLSGRSDACRDDTQSWLKATGFEEIELHMRAEGDTRKDAIVKAEIFDEHIRHQYNVIGVFDDRQQVVDMWRSMGLTVFQVAKGDF